MKKKLTTIFIILSLLLIAAPASFAAEGDNFSITKNWNDDLTGEDAAARQAPKVSVMGVMTQEEMLDFYYPVGSYYESSDPDFNPNDSFTGTWVKELEGMVHLSGGSSYNVSKANDNGGVGTKDGGDTDVRIGSHTHSIPAISGGTGTVSNDHAHYFGVAGNGGSKSGGGDLRNGGGSALWLSGISANHIHTATINGSTTGAAGSSGVNQNMQPYVNVNRWHRVS